jgi:hypothetical protein
MALDLNKNQEEDVLVLKTKANIDIKKIEAESSAKEVASKFIGKVAIPCIVILVIVGVLSSAFLPQESLPAVIGLVSTAAMALITMLAGITSSKEKEDKPEITIINSLIKNLEEAREPMSVTIDGDKVIVQKGQTSVSTKK